jgi:alpha,alpha-trehalase
MTSPKQFHRFLFQEPGNCRFRSTRPRFCFAAQACVIVALASLAFGQEVPAGQGTRSGGKGLAPILTYISASWDTLTRSMTECQSVVDPKVSAAAVVYLPAGMTEPAAVQKLSSDCKVEIRHLPVEIHRLGEIDTNKLQPPGLLYLENKYVVPGGRFNEMYGWDSYFIIRGLLLAGRVELARGMVDNFFFEVEHYGAMLNANRTYYLTRSQPPFLSSMFVEVYDALLKSGHTDPAWLAKAYSDLEKDYETWNRDPHLAGDTGLSRYYDFGEGPPQEALQDETGFHKKVATYFFFHSREADNYIVENAGNSITAPAYTLQVCDIAPPVAGEQCEKRQEFKLSADYYKGDRSMRESGFDVSFRFGPFGAATHHYAPVCLNSLLYKTEKDLEQISRWRGHATDAEKWSKRAQERKDRITRYLWDDKSGFFLDLNLQTGQKSDYRYVTTFYPLWAGLATLEQAKAVTKNISAFERPGGLAMSGEDTGTQWDLPYGWGNIQMLAVSGLRRYGFDTDADRISYEFLSTVAENFRRDGNIREKYNVVTRSSEARVELGYRMNVVGFGWTNAAFLELLRGLPKATVERLEREQNRPLASVAE